MKNITSLRSSLLLVLGGALGSFAATAILPQQGTTSSRVGLTPQQTAVLDQLGTWTLLDGSRALWVKTNLILQTNQVDNSSGNLILGNHYLNNVHASIISSPGGSFVRDAWNCNIFGNSSSYPVLGYNRTILGDFDNNTPGAPMGDNGVWLQKNGGSVYMKGNPQ